MTLRRYLLTLGGAGKLPYARISFLLVALPIGVGLLWFLGAQSLFSFAFALFLVGIFEINKYRQSYGKEKDASIVLDEAVGFWVALTVSAHGAALTPHLAAAFPLSIGLSVIVYLIFDLWKPSTIGWIERNVQGGLGMMLDDVLAGFAAGMFNLALFKIIAEVTKRFA